MSRWQFKLRATDSSNESVTELLDIAVHQHKSYRSVNHEIAVSVILNDKFRSNVDWQMRLIKGIVDIVGDAASVLVREIRYGIQDPNTATFIYTNESLPKDQCPEEKLDELFQVARSVCAKRKPRTSLSVFSSSLASAFNIESLGQCRFTAIIDQINHREANRPMLETRNSEADRAEANAALDQKLSAVAA